jgi:membrane protein DedA with SNARE-associated domain
MGRRQRLALIVAPIVVLVIMSNIGDALAPTLAVEHPLLLITLNARNRNLLLVTNQLDAVSYYVVGTLRLLVADPPFYLLGFFYGDRALAWVEERSSTFGTALRQYEQAFRYAAYPLVFLAPNNPICLFAGAAGMRPLWFGILNLSGTVTRLWALRAVGAAFEAPLEDVLGFIGRYRWPLTGLSIALVVFTLWRDKRSGTGDLEGITELEDELEELEDLGGGTGDTGEPGDTDDTDLSTQ